MTAEVVKSVGTQKEILHGVLKLEGLDTFDVDLTYGNGSFYKSTDITEPIHRFDIDGTLDGLTSVCLSDQTPLTDESVSSVVFDPPFLTYVRQGRNGNGTMIMARRFAGYWRYEELEAHYRSTLQEASRILKKGGVLVFKCQDIVHNHRLHATHINVVRWAEEHRFRLKDLYVLPSKTRLPAPNRKGKQRHARIFHSYFLVLERRR